jgi:NAD(P)-dependent dehydrogenase (short-subunit alcohol dehydrogenase family)
VVRVGVVGFIPVVNGGAFSSHFCKSAAELGDQARLVDATRRTLLPYIGDPEDIAEAVAFLSSDAARFITAQVLSVDGGWSV